MPHARSAVALLLAALALWAGAPARAQFELPPEEPRDQIVLAGDVLVRRGDEVAEVVVLRGTVVVAGLVRGDVVVIDGRIEIAGQVSGSVVNVGGPVTLGGSSHVGGDVIARGRVRVVPGAQVDGSVREGSAFTFRTPITALGRFAPWLAVWMSVLALGLLLLVLAPRGADAVWNASRTAPWASTGWGALAFVALPVTGAIAIVSLVWLPFGLGLLLALFLLYSIGLTLSAFALGRRIWREPRGRLLAFAIGWVILAAVSLIPWVGVLVWVAGAVFGLGATIVAAWRSRGAGGRHRPGGKMVVEVPEASATPEPSEEAPETAALQPMVSERETGREGMGL
jgi:hypothetical protein